MLSTAPAALCQQPLAARWPSMALLSKHSYVSGCPMLQHSALLAALCLQLQFGGGTCKKETRIHRMARKVLNFMYFGHACGKLTLPTQESIIRCQNMPWNCAQATPIWVHAGSPCFASGTHLFRTAA